MLIPQMEKVRENNMYSLNSPDLKLVDYNIWEILLEEATKQNMHHWTTSTNKKDGYRQLNVRQLGSLRPWDHRGKCYMRRKRIQCLSNASQHVPIYLQPFRSKSSYKIQKSPF